MRILVHAGAKSIVVEATDTKTKNAAVEAKANFLDPQGNLELTTSYETSASLEWKIESDGAADRLLPPDLIWFEHEPTWKTLWDSVISSGARRHEIEIAHSNNFGVTAALGAVIEKYGLSLGGKFEDITRSRISIRATFA